MTGHPCRGALAGAQTEADRLPPRVLPGRLYRGPAGRSHRRHRGASARDGLRDRLRRPPQAGIFTAVIAGFIISGLGGTRVSIGGPTGAFIVILYGINLEYGPANLALCTIMAGVILFLMGLTRMGAMIKFIPYPVTMGFTSGIAVLIFSTQIADFLGLAVERMPSDFVEKMGMLAAHAGTIHWSTAALAAGCLAVIRFWPKDLQRRPGVSHHIRPHGHR